MNWWQKIFASRSRLDPAQKIRWVLPYEVSGVRLTPDEALNLSAVWACVDAIAKAIASCDWCVYQSKSAGKRERLDDHIMAWKLNTRPNPDMTGIAFREALLYTAIPFGNAYAEIVLDKAGKISQLWPLEYERVMPRRDPGTNVMYYQYSQPDGGFVRLEANQVFHLKGPGLSGLLGENLVARAAKALSVAAAQERYSASFFGRGAHPSGVLEYPGKLTEEAFNRLKEDWAEKRQGPENAHKPMILEAGMKWTAVSVEPQKSQLMESRQFSVEEICRWFGVPPHKVQHLLRSTFNNIEHQSIEFVRDALTPWARRLEQEADYKFFKNDRAPWMYTQIDTAPLLHGDALSRAQAHAVWRQNGIMSANEIREREGMNDVGPEGDALLVQSNLTTVDLIVNPPKPPAPVQPQLPPGKDQQPNPQPGDTTTKTALRATSTIFTLALERYKGRLTNNSSNPERQRKWLVSECEVTADFATLAIGRPLTEKEVRRAAVFVEAGVTPETVVAEILAECSAEQEDRESILKRKET